MLKTCTSLSICLRALFTHSLSLRSWEKICVVLKESQIFFYKDQKTYRTHPGDTFKGETPVDLINCTAEVATDYTKKKYVFRLRYVVFSKSF